MTIQGDWNAGYVGFAIESTYGGGSSTLYAIPGRDVELSITPKRNTSEHNEVGVGQLNSYVSKGLQMCEWKLTYNLSNDFYGRSLLQVILSATATDNGDGTHTLTPGDTPTSIILEQPYGSIYRRIVGGVVTSATIDLREGDLVHVEINGQGYYSQESSGAPTAPSSVYTYEPLNATGDCSVTVNNGTSVIDYLIKNASIKFETGAKLHYGVKNGITPSAASKGKLAVSIDVEVLEEGESYIDSLDNDFTIAVSMTAPSGNDILVQLNNATITSDPELSARSDMGERTQKYTFVPTGGASGLTVKIPTNEV